jgi:hypothetical protein
MPMVARDGIEPFGFQIPQPLPNEAVKLMPGLVTATTPRYRCMTLCTDRSSLSPTEARVWQLLCAAS